MEETGEEYVSGLNEFEREAYGLAKKETGIDDVSFFQGMLWQAGKFYGISLKSGKGLELFRDVYLPDMVRMKEFYDRDPMHAMELYNNFVWDLDSGDLGRGGSWDSVFSEAGHPPATEGDPYSVTEDFVEKLEEFRFFVERDEMEEARNFFREADKKYKFSPIEALAVRKFHSDARRIYFISETDAESPEEEKGALRSRLLEDIDGFIKNAMKVEWARFNLVKKHYRSKLYKIATSVPFADAL